MTAFAAGRADPRDSEVLSGAPDRYRVLSDGAPVMMQAVDRDGRLAQVNGHWLKVLGYDHSEVMGRRPSTFMTEVSRSYALEASEDQFDRLGSSNDVGYQLVKKDGEVIDVLLSAVALPGANGEAGSVLVFMVDVTERRRAEAAVRELAVIEERDRLARELHDTLTQSLSSISLQLGVASDLMQVSLPQALSHLESARALTGDVLEEARRSIWDLQPLALESLSLTQAVCNEVARSSLNGVRVSVEIAGEAPRAFDRHNEQTALRVVQEALCNIGRHARAENALVRLSFGSSALHLEISDDGDGFPPSTLRRAPRPGGGFGLIAMRERARLTGGTIEVRSTPRQGTEIRVQVPYETTATAADPVEALAAARGGRRPAADGTIRVLIVDDHEALRFGIRGILERSEGITVAGEADNGERGVEMALALAPDIVLLDVRMPKLDGMATIRRMHELGSTARVILLSAFSGDEHVLEGLRAGARAYLLKDVSPDDLVRSIRSVHDGGSLLQPVIAAQLMTRLDIGEYPHLTGRERQVLLLLAHGARNKEMAHDLGVSVNTIKFHIDNVFKKLGTRTRTEAVRVARERSLLDD